MNTKLIIAIIIVILVAVVGIFAFSPSGPSDTQINFISQTTLKNGDQIQFVLTDSQGNAIANQEVTITYDDQTYTVVTDAEGKGALLLEDQETGEHAVSVSYTGNDQYKPCQAQQTITIEDGTSDSTQSSSSDSSVSTSSDSSSSDSNSQLNYNSEYNVYYDNNGIVHGGQSDGDTIDNIIHGAEDHAKDFD